MTFLPALSENARWAAVPGLVNFFTYSRPVLKYAALERVSLPPTQVPCCRGDACHADVGACRTEVQSTFETLSASLHVRPTEPPLRTGAPGALNAARRQHGDGQASNRP